MCRALGRTELPEEARQKAADIIADIDDLEGWKT
jgi:hypothetical protein